MNIKDSLQHFSSNRTEENRSKLLSDMEKWTLFIVIRWVDKQMLRILHIQDRKDLIKWKQTIRYLFG